MKPILTHFRAGYEQATLPLGRICLRLGLSPDMLTLISLAFGGLAAFLAARSAFILSVVAILLMGLADVLDGATARASQRVSSFGTVLDHVVDRYAEFAILLGIALSGAAAPGWVIFALFGMIMASYVRARAEASGMVASCSVGFAGRQEKLGLLMVGMVIQELLPATGVLQGAVIVVGLLSHVTALQRLLYARRVILSAEQGSRSENTHRQSI